MRDFRLRTFDIVIALTVLLIGLILFAWTQTSPFSESPRQATVAVAYQNEIVETLPLYQDKTIVFQKDGKTNVIEVKSGLVQITKANCSNQTCVHTKPCSKSGEMIVCLPHRLVVTIEGGELSEIDGIAE